ncbi:UDP-GlcNAc:undecaprenyl-phosphate GlcNAc-1-phosphate transferase [Pantoea agglomerans]|jgi:UDP-GlcNAc:undecaprenyl-phosphate GlcNAc-1-phosphate transferase|uniref:UDP-N-acetylglucosamine--undecaprenyl-phosphate N-acetylglucosaminephosphotransferase n=1 Tax=Enterobacter agglomerans TaxID=549 RepID=UPI0013BC1E39|nr:UDP-N-acetylglucosamine--undecaprenyl-phosphate N-acetylglucosaminephosphotransferase [Pantoea agglomerans]MDQ0431036.1 UDP-GlcNAc:undecaprenyl-phosphate GlcNAc-1-phosphate transferase [Pantoea agglomerans]NEG84757.1 UDP-N-acetylglucosamine--undecaprenyl-phosphate N-acetylglucosaminephosphotransferase [Pantoea agglomerans]NEH06898.1 UDP-N-acetylglucosamine--undecaprenyl-phosphate N-acetylglucosaminephosphotransferase [Pantoea agglomerans]
MIHLNGTGHDPCSPWAVAWGKDYKSHHERIYHHAITKFIAHEQRLLLRAFMMAYCVLKKHSLENILCRLISSPDTLASESMKCGNFKLNDLFEWHRACPLFTMGGSVEKKVTGAAMCDAISIFFIAMTALIIAYPLARKYSLVDKPGGRKQHSGNIPLVGGISLYCGIVIFHFLQPDIAPFTNSNLTAYIAAISILLAVGIADDYYDLPVMTRILAQASAVIVIILDDVYLNTFGFVLGEYELSLGPAGYLITLLAGWAAINAFNMIDGIDGLLGSVSAVIFAALMVKFMSAGAKQPAMWCLLMIVALLPYLVSNFGLAGAKVFMGDAGSMVIGFTMLWLILNASQGNQAVMAPVTALWILALPLMDMVNVMIRRLRRRQSPFHADRDHLHHILLRCGLTSRQTLLVMVLLTATLAGMGLTLEKFAATESVSIALYLAVFGIYVLMNNALQQRHPDPRALAVR